MNKLIVIALLINLAIMTVSFFTWFITTSGDAGSMFIVSSGILLGQLLGYKLAAITRRRFSK